MGASESEIKIFEERLSEFKTLLLKLYRQKTKMIAEREAWRFKYISGLKTKLNNIIAAMLAQSYTDEKFTIHGIIENFTNQLRREIPMASVSGGPVKDYGRNPPLHSNNNEVGFLSPMADLITKPAYPESYSTYDRRLMYVVFLEQYAKSMTVDDVLEREFFYYMNRVSNQQEMIPFDIPPSKVWFNTVFGSQSGGIDDNNFGYITSLMTKNFPEYGGSLKSTVDEMYSLLKDIVKRTFEIMNLQSEIDEVEADLSFMVSEFSDYAKSIGLNVSDLLRDLKLAAEESDQQPIPIEAISEIAPKKSNWPWLVAAAVGIMVVTQSERK